MTRRQFIHNAAIATVVSPQVPAVIARATAPAAQQLFYADWCDIVWPKAHKAVSYDFIGGPAQCEAFRKLWADGMERYYGKQ